MSTSADEPTSVFSRRHLFKWVTGGAGALVVGAGAGIELVNHGVLPGKQLLDQIDGACSLPTPTLDWPSLGPSFAGTFYSPARRRHVNYVTAYPPGHRRGDELALVVMLHGFGGTHRDAFVDMTPVQAAALRTGAASSPALAIVTVDGGSGYWNPHPGDDPMAMVIDELIPRCRAQGLGRPLHGVGLMGISMGGYGALAMGERFPEVISAVAAISPAVWTSFDQARAANAGAFASAAAFSENDVIAHASHLAHTPVRVVSGVDDPFHPGVVALLAALPASSVTYVGPGCHSGPFFLSQEAPSLAFLASHVS